ncbi:MAG TPA: hypothetical protein VM840_07150 [Actinomycetota bacterium]|nr:hypothetical protein [Actinomycetota bacterium]
METQAYSADRAEYSGERVGEIVEASTTRFRAVSVRAFEPPAFGSFVRSVSTDRVTYGVVSHVAHGSTDPSRRAIPLGRTWEELVAEHPQVFDLLQTEFEAITVAFCPNGGEVHGFLPPVPPRVHDFVTLCADHEIRALTADLSFVRTLGASGLPVTGELLAAAIRGAAAAREDGRSFLLRAGREVADLYRSDYEQACAVLRRLGMRIAGDDFERRVPEAVAVRRSSAK